MKREAAFSIVGMIALAFATSFARSRAAGTNPRANPPTFYRDVLPILQQHCQSCHRVGEIAPMPLVSYDETKIFAFAIASDARRGKMPPWFADPQVGHFSNDPSLSPDEVRTLADWAAANAPAGKPKDAPPPAQFVEGWNIARPDVVIRMPTAAAVPALCDIDYTYEIVHTGFTEGKWVQAAEIRPERREHVHHAVVYIRPPGSAWLRNAPIGVPFTAATMPADVSVQETRFTRADILLVYAPGSSPDDWPAGMAKFIPAGSDLIFQMHYTSGSRATSDRTAIGLVFAKEPPAQRVLTLQLTNSRFIIPPGVDDFRVEVHGTMPHDALLLSFFPHMHLRGKRFEYNILHSDGTIQPLLRVNYDFYWQLSYRLAQPMPLKAGAVLQAVGWYDNSRKNPHNPDPDVSVRWGEQTYDEMMVGFFDVAVPASVDKTEFFTHDSDEN